MSRFVGMVLAAGGLLAPVLATAETAAVAVRESVVRRECGFFSTVVVKVRNNDMLEILAHEGEWLRVSVKGFAGCIHKSAMIRRTPPVDHLLSEDRHFADDEEVTLAGKGFTPEVEAGYQEQKPEVDFSRVDALERAAPSESDLKTFAAEGGLRLPP